METTRRELATALKEGLRDLFHPPKGNLPALDVLRSAAIVLVFTGHYVGEYHAPPSIQNFPVFRWGWTGVDLFFVLSGLLIGSQLWKELARTGSIKIGHFLLRRGLRIWPLYYAFVAFTIFARLFFGKDLKGIWSDLIFFTNFVQGHLAGGWSLSTEEQFYVVTPLLLSFFALWMSQRRLWFVPPLAIGVLICSRTWISLHSSLPEAELRRKLYYPIFTHADGLAVGVFLAWISVFHKEWLRSTIISAGAVLTMLLSALALYRANAVLWNFTALGLIYGSMGLYGISALPLLAVARWRGFYLVSRLSYGIYLNHFVVLPLLYPFLYEWTRHIVVRFWLAYVVCLLVSIMIAIVTFLAIEWPFLRIRARWVDHTRAATMGAI